MNEKYERIAPIALLIAGIFIVVFVSIKASLDNTLVAIYDLILAATLTVITAFYAYSAAQSVKASNKQAEIMLNAEFNAAAPVIKLHAGTSEGKVHVNFKNVGKGPALNLKCWIDDDEHPELRASSKMTYRTAFGIDEADNFVFDTGIKDYKFGIGCVKCEYESIFMKKYESILVFSSDPIPELKYGESIMMTQRPQTTNLGNVSQLDRIEQSMQQIEMVLKKGELSNLRLWLLAVAIALIIATPTLITTNLCLAIAMFVLGTLLIAFGAFYKK